MREKVIKVFAEVAKVDEKEVSESTSLRCRILKNDTNYLDFDFIDEIRVILRLERVFDIKLPDDFLDDANKVGDIIDKLKKMI